MLHCGAGTGAAIVHTSARSVEEPRNRSEDHGLVISWSQVRILPGARSAIARWRESRGASHLLVAGSNPAGGTNRRHAHVKTHTISSRALIGPIGAPIRERFLLRHSLPLRHRQLHRNGRNPHPPAQSQITPKRRFSHEAANGATRGFLRVNAEPCPRATLALT